MQLERKVQQLKNWSIWFQALGLVCLFLIHTYAAPSVVGKLKLGVFIAMLLQAVSFAIWRKYLTSKQLIKRQQPLAKQD